MVGPVFGFSAAAGTSFSTASSFTHMNADLGGIAPLARMNQHRLPSISRHDQYTPCCSRPGASWQRIAASAALPAAIEIKMTAADMLFIGTHPSFTLPETWNRWIARIKTTNVSKRRQAIPAHTAFFVRRHAPTRTTPLLAVQVGLPIR